MARSKHTAEQIIDKLRPDAPEALRSAVVLGAEPAQAACGHVLEHAGALIPPRPDPVRVRPSGCASGGSASYGDGLL